MKFEQPQLNKEKTDWDYAREVRSLMGHGKNFDAACAQVIKKVPKDEQAGFYSRIGTICAEISAQVKKSRRKAMAQEDEIKEPPKPQESWAQSNDRLQKDSIYKANPLFPDLDLRHRLVQEMEELDRGKKPAKRKIKKQAA